MVARISEELARENREEMNNSGNGRLKKAEYQSPEHGPFRCSNCKFAVILSCVPRPIPKRGLLHCRNDDIRAEVEAGGCCNYFDRR